MKKEMIEQIKANCDAVSLDKAKKELKDLGISDSLFNNLEHILESIGSIAGSAIQIAIDKDNPNVFHILGPQMSLLKLYRSFSSFEGGAILEEDSVTLDFEKIMPSIVDSCDAIEKGLKELEEVKKAEDERCDCNNCESAADCGVKTILDDIGSFVKEDVAFETDKKKDECKIFCTEKGISKLSEVFKKMDCIVSIEKESITINLVKVYELYIGRKETFKKAFFDNLAEEVLRVRNREMKKIDGNPDINVIEGMTNLFEYGLEVLKYRKYIDENFENLKKEFCEKNSCSFHATLKEFKDYVCKIIDEVDAKSIFVPPAES